MMFNIIIIFIIILPTKFLLFLSLSLSLSLSLILQYDFFPQFHQFPLRVYHTHVHERRRLDKIKNR